MSTTNKITAVSCLSVPYIVDTRVEADDIDDQDMERMLSELTNIVPPTSLPVTDSLTSTGSGMEENESETNDSLDSLVLMRKRLEETFTEIDESLPVEQPPVENIPITANKEDGPGEESVSVNVQPPTPTVTSQTKLGLNENNPTLGVDTTAGDAEKLVNEGENTLDSVTSVKHSGTVAVPGIPTKSNKVGVSSGTSSPCFSPASLRNSPEPSSKVSTYILCVLALVLIRTLAIEGVCFTVIHSISTCAYQYTSNKGCLFYSDTLNKHLCLSVH